MGKRHGYRGYIFSRPFFGERVPQHVQNLVIRDYATRNGLTYKLSATEYAMPGCSMMLTQVMEELPELEGVIFYSLFQLPVNSAERQLVFERFLDCGATFHTALEGFSLRRSQDIEFIEDIWRVRQILPDCPTTADFSNIT